MDLSELRIFRAVVREGGITRAAAHLNRVQSNVTTRVRQLEDKLGTPLFSRTGRKLVLTPAGHRLMVYADRLLDLAEEARLAVCAAAPGGPFRLGAMESTAAVRLPGPISALVALYPDIQVELKTGNPVALAAALRRGEIDAALAAMPGGAEDFVTRVAWREEPVLVTAKNAPDPGLEGIPETILVFEAGCPHRRLLEDWVAALGNRPGRVIELGSYHAMLGSVLAGMGAALVPMSVIATFPEAKRLRVTRPDSPRRVLETLLIWRPGLDSANLRAFQDVLQSGDTRAS